MKKIKHWLDDKMVALHSVIVRKNEGLGTVEILLIIACLVAIVVIFKEQITELVESIFSKITSRANKI